MIDKVQRAVAYREIARITEEQGRKDKVREMESSTVAEAAAAATDNQEEAMMTQQVANQRIDTEKLEESQRKLVEISKLLSTFSTELVQQEHVVGLIYDDIVKSAF